MKLFRKKESRATMESILLESGLITNGETITKKQALEIPVVAACVELISNTVASLDIKLYRESNGDIDEVNENRVKLLNDSTGDTLDSFQWKKAVVTDYLLCGDGYTYINKQRNVVKSLNYVDCDNVSVQSNYDPIFKSNEILVQGAFYRDFEFLKLLRKSKDGATGTGIVEENNKILSVAYNTLLFEDVLIRKGGNKKGFLKSKHKLTDAAMQALKDTWRNLYSNNKENMMVLNEGLEFQESSNTSVEMQLNENKKSNNLAICNIFNVPIAVLEGKSSEIEYNNFIKICIVPILKAFETMLNKDLLLESEKDSFYFAFDTKDLLKGDMEKRYRAYEIALKNGFLGINEVRYFEDWESIEGFDDIVKLGLADVLYNVKTKEIYTPNTNAKSSINTMKGGEIDNENRN